MAQQGGQGGRGNGRMTWHVSLDRVPCFWFLVVFNKVVGVTSGASDDLVLQDYSI